MLRFVMGNGSTMAGFQTFCKLANINLLKDKLLNCGYY